jgi:pimeloyl-ACP methyl ester carboxylesterase
MAGKGEGRKRRRRGRRWRGTRVWIAALAVVVAGAGALVAQVDRTQLWEDQAVHAGWRLQTHVWNGRCRLLDRTGDTRARGRGGHCAEALARARVEEGLRPASDHLVLLLHGLGRSPRLFRPMVEALRAAGYEAVAIGYPSLTKDIDGHAAQLNRLLDRVEGVGRVSFVTHSLGGIVLREALAGEASWRERLALGRIVMLAPPNQGSEMASALDDLRLFRRLGGPSAGQLVKGGRYAALSDGVDFGVIAGGTSGGRGFNPLLSANNDGVVTVEETRLAGARDFLIVTALHTVIASNPETIAATLAFLATGGFR